jgi:hypothetical protein
MKTPVKHTLLFLLAAVAPIHAEDPCQSIYLNIKNRVDASPDRATEIVGTEISASASCACEIVKAAIEASHADAKTVAAMVEAAINAAPEQMRLIAQCAIAVAPDALAEVQAVLARLDPNRGESGTSGKDAKSAKDLVDSKGSTDTVAFLFNPLDFPGQGPIGPTPGGPGGLPLIPMSSVVIINPPLVTDVNP